MIHLFKYRQLFIQPPDEILSAFVQAPLQTVTLTQESTSVVAVQNATATKPLGQAYIFQQTATVYNEQHTSFTQSNPFVLSLAQNIGLQEPLLGTGTDIDPYQIRTKAHFIGITDSSTEHYLLMNDIDMEFGVETVGSIINGQDGKFKARLDGGGFTVYNWSAGRLFSSYGDCSIKNITFRTYHTHIEQYQPIHLIANHSYEYAHQSLANITLQNIKWIQDAPLDDGVNAPYHTFGDKIRSSYFLFTELESTCVVDNIILEGAFAGFIPDFVRCDVTNVFINSTVPANDFKFLKNLNDASLENITVYANGVDSNFDTSLHFIDNLTATVPQTINNILFVVRGHIARQLSFINLTSSYYTITNCAVHSSLENLTSGRNLDKLPVGLFCVNSWSPVSNTVVTLDLTDNVREPVSKIRGFDSWNYGDWYIPSKDEMALVFALKRQLRSDVLDFSLNHWEDADYAPSYTQGSIELMDNACFITSSESSADEFYVEGNENATTQPKDRYLQGILARDLTNITAGLGVGEYFEDTLIIYINGSNGIGISFKPLSDMGIFSWGSKGTLLGTGTAVGTGKANTALMLASNVDNWGLANWSNYDYPVGKLPYADYINGLFARSDFENGASDNYFSFKSTELSAPIQTGVENKTEAELKVQGTYANWDFVNDWNPPTATEYPTPKGLLNYTPELINVSTYGFQHDDLGNCSFHYSAMGLADGTTFGVEVIKAKVQKEELYVNDPDMSEVETSLTAKFTVTGALLSAPVTVAIPLKYEGINFNFGVFMPLVMDVLKREREITDNYILSFPFVQTYQKTVIRIQPKVIAPHDPTLQISSEWFGIDLAYNRSSTFQEGVYEVLHTESAVSGSDLISKATASFTLAEVKDTEMIVRSYATIETVKTYASNWGNSVFFHYGVPQLEVDYLAVSPQNYIARLENGDSSIQTDLVHGSLLYNGFVYGTPRGNNSQFCKVDITDYSNLTFINQNGPLDARYSGAQCAGFEQVVRIGRFLYSLGYRSNLSPAGTPTGQYIVQVDTLDDSVKMFNLWNVYSSLGNIDEVVAMVPINTDGTYLYVSGRRYCHKIDPIHFQNFEGDLYDGSEGEGANTCFALEHLPTWMQDGWTYDDQSQGRIVDFPEEYVVGDFKGWLHAAKADGEYLYNAYNSGYNSGFDNVGGYSTREVHAVRTSDMTPAGWTHIPQSTDDMTANDDYLFFGIELQPDADKRTYGYGWGTYAVKKSLLISQSYNAPVYGIPKLHATDDPPYVQSYASLVFGTYLLDFKTNQTVHIIDISDVENWSVTEDIGKRTLALFKLEFAQAANPRNYQNIPNEAMLDQANYFHMFMWGSPSGISKVQIPDFDFYEVPSVQSISSSVDLFDVTLEGYILNDNGNPVTEEGFEYGTVNDPAQFTRVPIVGVPQSFTEILEDLGVNTYYWRAYATNFTGTGYGSIETFEVLPLSADAYPSAISHSVTIELGSVIGGTGIAFDPSIISHNLNIPDVSVTAIRQVTFNHEVLTAITNVLNSTVNSAEAIQIDPLTISATVDIKTASAGGEISANITPDVIAVLSDILNAQIAIDENLAIVVNPLIIDVNTGVPTVTIDVDALYHVIVNPIPVNAQTVIRYSIAITNVESEVSEIIAIQVRLTPTINNNTSVILSTTEKNRSVVLSTTEKTI